MISIRLAKTTSLGRRTLSWTS